MDESKECSCSSHGKFLGIALIPSTPFESWMSISTHLDKMEENAQIILSDKEESIKSGKLVIISKDLLSKTKK